MEHKLKFVIAQVVLGIVVFLAISIVPVLMVLEDLMYPGSWWGHAICAFVVVLWYGIFFHKLCAEIRGK